MHQETWLGLARKVLNNCTGEFIGSLTAISCDELLNIVFVRDETKDSAPQQHSRVQVMPYVEDESEGLETNALRNLSETFKSFRFINDICDVHLTDTIHPGDPDRNTNA